MASYATAYLYGSHREDYEDYNPLILKLHNQESYRQKMRRYNIMYKGDLRKQVSKLMPTIKNLNSSNVGGSSSSGVGGGSSNVAGASSVVTSAGGTSSAATSAAIAAAVATAAASGTNSLSTTSNTKEPLPTNEVELTSIYTGPSIKDTTLTATPVESVDHLLNADYQGLCILCQDSKACVMVNPCQHMLFCKKCVASGFCRRFCPVCRSNITSMTQVSYIKMIRPRIFSSYSKLNLHLE